MVITVLDHEFQNELCESDSEYPPKKVEDGEVDDDGKPKRTGMCSLSQHELEDYMIFLQFHNMVFQFNSSFFSF